MALSRPKQSETAAAEAEESQAVETQARTEEHAAPEVDESQLEDVSPEGSVDADDVDTGNDEPTPPTRESNITVAQSGTQVATSQQSSGMAELKRGLAEQGFEDIELSSLGFDRVVIANGDFQYGQSKDSMGRAFTGNIEQCKNVQLVTRSDDDDDDELFYTYDKHPLTNPDVVNTEGKPQGHRLAEWRAEGHEDTISVRTYKEVLVEVVECPEAPELAGEYLMCSIPPASVKRFDAQVVIAAKRFKAMPNDLQANFKVGKTIKNGNNTFNPWDVKLSPKPAE